jgi:hypothetical protein
MAHLAPSFASAPVYHKFARQSPTRNAAEFLSNILPLEQLFFVNIIAQKLHVLIFDKKTFPPYLVYVC